MMRFLVLLLLMMPLRAAAGVADDATAASAQLQEAVAGLEEAVEAKDRVAALTRTIKAYENGLAALREALRQADLRDTQLTLQFQTKRARIAQLLAVLGRLDADPGPLLLLHPNGPLGTVRSGMMLADVTPALQAEVDGLKAQLTELADLRALQSAAGETLGKGLTAAQTARQALSQAISDRTELPRRFTEDPDVLRGLLESADTLEAFASGLSLDDSSSSGFADAKGALDLPGVFEEPVVPIDQLSSQLQWKLDGDKVQVQVSKARFANADAEGEAEATWRTSDPAVSHGKSRQPGSHRNPR